MDAELPYILSRPLALSPKAAGTYETALEDSEVALEMLMREQPRLEVFTNVERTDDLAAAKIVARELAFKSSVLFVLGIGGSSLGGQALKAGLEVLFFDNPDPITYERALASCDLKTTRFIAISKSGGTPETLAQTLIAADVLKRAGGQNRLNRHFVVITEPKKSPLREFAKEIECPVLDHPVGIGGRYSVLSVVGLLPALLMGLDAEALRE